MGVVLFVHGMGYNSNRNYWKEWSVPLQLELARQGLVLTEDDFGGVYYYDLVPGPAAGKLPKEDILQIQLLGLKNRAREKLGVSGLSYTRNYNVVRNFADYIVDNFGDIYSYLYLKQTYQKVNERVYQTIAQYDGPVTLIGYSLGTIVSFCALMENEKMASKVCHLLMLGSPLFWFEQGVARHVNLSLRPAVGRLTNVAGILDIAWPHMVPKILPVLDQYVELIINYNNPLKGHKDYFNHQESLKVIAREIIKGWK